MSSSFAGVAATAAKAGTPAAGAETRSFGASMEFEVGRMYRVKVVAEALDVSLATIYRAIESGRLDALKLGTGKGTLRIPGYAANAYVSSCTGSARQPLPAEHDSPAADHSAQEVS